MCTQRYVMGFPVPKTPALIMHVHYTRMCAANFFLASCVAFETRFSVRRPINMFVFIIFGD